MSFPPEFLDDLRARVGLVSLIGRRVKLVRAGREMKGCCPFHNEKSPSFYVNEEKGFYHCFGCGAHGDAIRFLTENDGLTFLEAIKLLAEEVGLEVPQMRAPDPVQQKRAGLQDLIAATGQFYEQQLNQPHGATARAYIEKRAVTPSLQKQFGFGYAPDNKDALFKHLKSQFPEMEFSQMLEAGLAGESDDGRRYDRFRGRLMFPIHDPRGRPVGFGGRILGEGEPKYLNSPDGPVFHKGKLLYNYHRAAPAARKAGRLLIVEGYMDVVGLAGAGVIEAVAPLGTALTEDQILLAWKLATEPVLAFDGDAAGRRAGLRAATRALPLIGPGRSLSFVTLPKGQDPDDLAKSGGKAAIEALLERAIPLERFLFDEEVSVGPLDTPERRAAFKARLKALAGDIQDPEIRRDYLQTWFDRAESLWRPQGRAPFGEPRQGRNAGGYGNRQPRLGGRPTGSGGAGNWGQMPQPLRPETRAANSSAMEIHVGMLLKLLSLRPDLAEMQAEALVELPIRSPDLARARDHILAGKSAEDLLSGFRPLSFGDVDEETLAREIATTLAQCIEAHHIGSLERQAIRTGTDQSLEEAFERNRAAAQDVMNRLGLTPAIHGDNDQA